MSSPVEQPERHGTPPEISSEVGPQKTYALIYAPGPQWLAGRPVTEQNLGPHRAYMAELYARGRVLLGGPFLDDAGGGVALLRAKGRDEATALLAADPAIREGVFTGVVRRWHAVFNEAEDLHAALSRASANKGAVKALFKAVDRHDPRSGQPSLWRRLSRARRRTAPRPGISSRLGSLPARRGARP
jgi:uncharacterized protein YciI